MTLPMISMPGWEDVHASGTKVEWGSDLPLLPLGDQPWLYGLHNRGYLCDGKRKKPQFCGKEKIGEDFIDTFCGFSWVVPESVGPPSYPSYKLVYNILQPYDCNPNSL